MKKAFFLVLPLALALLLVACGQTEALETDEPIATETEGSKEPSDNRLTLALMPGADDDKLFSYLSLDLGEYRMLD